MWSAHIRRLIYKFAPRLGETVHHIIHSPKWERPFGRLLKNTGWLYAGGLFNTLLTTAQALFAARFLGAEGYGRLALVLASVGIVAQFADFRTWEVSIRFLPEKLRDNHPKDDAIGFVQSLIFLDIFSGVVASGMVLAASRWLAVAIAHDEQITPLIRLYAISMPMTLVWGGTCTGVLRVLDRFDLVTAKFIFLSTIQLLGVIAVLVLGYGLPGVVIVNVLMEILNALVSIALVGFTWKVKISDLLKVNIQLVMTQLGKVRSFLGQVWLSGTIKGVGLRADVALLGALTSPATVGIYRLALDLAGVLNKLGNPIQAAILPVFVELESLRDLRALRRLAARTTALLSVFVLPVVAGLAFLATGIVGTLAGHSYQEARAPLVILAIGMGVNSILIWSRPILVARSMVGHGNIIAAFGLMIEIIVIFVLARPYGAAGAAIATGLEITFAAVACAWVALGAGGISRSSKAVL